MQHLFKKFFLFAFLGVFLSSFPVYLNASETADDRLLRSQASAEHNQAQTLSEPNIANSAVSVIFKSRLEIYAVFFGTVMIIIGLVAVALTLYR